MRLINILGFIIIFVTFQSQATLSPRVDTPRSNDFLFIDNKEDSNYFVTPLARLNPRLTGGNVWTTLKHTRQRSLAYVSFYTNYTDSPNYNFDMWETDSPISSPYINQRCIYSYSRCDPETSGAIAQPILVDDKGFYKVNPMADGWQHALISSNFFEYLKSMPLGSTLTRTMNSCTTREDYNPLLGQRCIDMNTGTWRQQTISHVKNAHLTFKRTNAVSELMVDSSGNAIILPGSVGCELGSAIRRDEGVICEFLRYDLQNTGEAKFTTINLSTELIGGMTAPSNYDLQMSINKADWVINGANLRLDKLIGYNTVYIFMSNAFLKKMFDLGLENVKTRDLVNFQFYNSLSPGSGYYDISGTTEIIVKPREFSVSIIPEDGFSKPHQEGTVGQDELSFGYNIITSAPTTATSLEISLSQDKNYGVPNLNYLDYCNFYPEGSFDVNKSVAVPVRLSFMTNSGGKYNELIDCWGRSVSLLENGIAKSQSSIVDLLPDGSPVFTDFYNIKLNFDLKDPSLEFTYDGSLWEGYVHQSGEIRVSASWN
ncbi:hypothetical protein [Shewanella algae]|uniref:hypothetical protein n=1 Tax=Shewanella algae TaxID=38313 RepID=UPI001182E10E|nr:hypothetical protein [Shewanella algae]